MEAVRRPPNRPAVGDPSDAVHAPDATPLYDVRCRRFPAPPGAHVVDLYTRTYRHTLTRSSVIQPQPLSTPQGTKPFNTLTPSNAVKRRLNAVKRR